MVDGPGNEILAHCRLSTINHLPSTIYHLPLVLLTLLTAALLSADSLRFPTVTFDNLEKRTMTLPRDFGGERNVVFVAFLRKQQDDVDTWVPFVKPLVARTPNTEFYEIPTIKRMIAPMRWMINSGMRGGIDDKGARERTITLYLDKEPFKQALGITDENTISVMIVDREGRVLWRTTGVFTTAKGAELEAALVGRRERGADGGRRAEDGQALRPSGRPSPCRATPIAPL